MHARQHAPAAAPAPAPLVHLRLLIRRALLLPQDKQPKCGEGCSVPQFSAVGNCSTAPGGNAEDICRGHAKFGEVHCEACHDSEHYSTILFGTHARAVIAAHPAETPLFLYLPVSPTTSFCFAQKHFLISSPETK